MSFSKNPKAVSHHFWYLSCILKRQFLFLTVVVPTSSGRPIVPIIPSEVQNMAMEDENPMASQMGNCKYLDISHHPAYLHCDKQCHSAIYFLDREILAWRLFLTKEQKILILLFLLLIYIYI